MSIIPTEDVSRFCDQWIERSEKGQLSGDEWILGIDLPGVGLIGNVALHRSVNGNEAELGYWLDPRYVGKGYAREACQALVHWAFTQGGFTLIVATCGVDNHPSAKLLRCLGMREEGLTPILTANGIKRPSRRFSVEKEAFNLLGY